MPIITTEELARTIRDVQHETIKIERNNFKHIVHELRSHGQEPMPDDLYKSLCSNKKLMERSFDILLEQVCVKLLSDIDSLPYPGIVL